MSLDVPKSYTEVSKRERKGGKEGKKEKIEIVYLLKPSILPKPETKFI